MKKNGFILLETIVVLMVVTLSLSILLASYSLISRKTNEKLYYDNTSDIYLLYSITKLGVDSKNSYYKMSNAAISVDNCENMYQMTGINIYNSSGEDYCKDVFNSVGLKKIYIVNDVYNALNNIYPSSSQGYVIGYDNSKIYSKKAIEIFDNGTIEYMKTLKKCYNSEGVYNTIDTNNNSGKYYAKSITDSKNCSKPIKYMIGVFYRNNKYYYASIEI